MTPKSKYSCNSAIWDSKMHGKYIYLACEDGTVKILKIKKGKIEFVRSLYKAEARCLSLELLTNGIDENTMVKGLFSAYSDSSFRKWDLSSGNSILHFQKQTKKNQKAKGECMIWKIKLFKDFLVSGDSKGEVSIWDAQFGTLIKTFNNLKADINTIEINSEFNTIYASGVDSRVLAVQLKDQT